MQPMLNDPSDTLVGSLVAAGISNNYDEPSCITTIQLFLRRTLVHLVRYSAMKLNQLKQDAE